MDQKNILNECLTIMDAMKAESVLVIDLDKKTIIADYFIIVTAKNNLHSKAIFNVLVETINKGKKKYFQTSMSDSSQGWRILDYATVVVHIFLKEDRQKYDLESLWNKEYSNMMQRKDG